MKLVKLTFWKRLISPTPEFFKKIRRIGAYLTTSSVIVIAANSQFNLNLPPVIDTLGKVLGYGGFIAVTISSFAVDTDKMKEQGEIPIK